ncbi:STAS-like domain-containing protein [Achromobacter dolens]|uniref:STAS-like domain-containing protein n=2 Tax=Achromobacter TaxID=222 RepID=UPI0009E965B8|nr:STAS-like domain-containing protein [Achromobacter dolens]
MMTTSIFKISVSEQFKLATRPNGAEARHFVMQMLEEHDEVELDFSGSDPTPSFADECIGILCRNIGWDSFRARIHITNVSESSRSLLKHVLTRRRGEARPNIFA